MNATVEESWEIERNQTGNGSLKNILKCFRAAVLIVGVLVVLAWWWFTPPRNPLVRAEGEHGIMLPKSASNIQCQGNAWHGFLDRDVSTIFELNSADLRGFLTQLKVMKRENPITQNLADPLDSEVWPGDFRWEFTGYGYVFQKSWMGPGVPIERMNCSSPAGADWLHVEIWKLSQTRTLVKMNSDWN